MLDSNEKSGRAAGPWWSHLAYGLGVMAFFAPFAIPGLNARTLFVIYFAVVTTAISFVLIWGVVRSVREAWAKRRPRNRNNLF